MANLSVIIGVIGSVVLLELAYVVADYYFQSHKWYQRQTLLQEADKLLANLKLIVKKDSEDEKEHHSLR